MTNKGTKELTTQRLRLRRFTLSDAEAIYNNWASDSQVAEFMFWTAHKDINVTREILFQWTGLYNSVDGDSYYNWAVEYEGQLVGYVVIFPSFECYEIGYCIGRRWWKKGIASEAAAAVIDYAFGQCDFPRLFARFCFNNEGSGGVLQKLGMVKEGHLRQQGVLHDGTRTDIVIYGILKSDWSRQKTR